MLSVSLFSLSLFSLLGTTPAYAAPDIRLQPTPSQDSYRACKSLSQCASILERHAADEFDYALLASSFERYGQKGRERLWAYIQASEAEGRAPTPEHTMLANRALDMLSRSPSLLTPAEQRRAADIWKRLETSPYEPRFVARILINNLSPLVRSAAIQTLSSSNKDIAKRSRDILNIALSRKLKFPMLESDFAPLSRALQKKAEPTLIALLALYDAEKASPSLSAVLRSGDTPSVIAAYSALYEYDPESAFKALVGTLYKLGPNDEDTALSLAALLAHRHPLRSDGFYMTFARDLMKDPQMNAVGQLAGFDAIMRSFGPAGFAKEADTKQLLPHYEAGLRALKGKILPESYLAAVQTLGARDKGRQSQWLTVLDAAALHPVSRVSVTEIAGALDSPQARSITARARKAPADYRLLIAGILAGAAQSPAAPEFAQKLETEFAAHPISLVRSAARIAQDALKSKNPRKRILSTQDQLTKTAETLDPVRAYCEIKSGNLRALARPMPFYSDVNLANGALSERAYLTSAARHSGGWLAGYSRPRDGGLVAYQNSGAKAPELFSASDFGPQSVIAVHPTRPVPLGQTAKHFWVIGQSLISADVTLFRISQNSAQNSAQNDAVDFDISRTAVLPALPEKINIAKDGEIQIGFGRKNPPLSVFPNGQITRSCRAK